MDPGGQRGNYHGLPQESKLMLYMNHQATKPKQSTYSAVTAQSAQMHSSRSNMPTSTNLVTNTNMAAPHSYPGMSQASMVPQGTSMMTSNIPGPSNMPSTSSFVPHSGQVSSMGASNIPPLTSIHTNLSGLTDLGVLPNLGSHMSMSHHNLPSAPSTMMASGYGTRDLTHIGVIANRQNIVHSNLGLGVGPLGGLGAPSTMMTSGIANHNANFGDIGVISSIGPHSSHIGDIGGIPNLGLAGMMPPTFPPHSGSLGPQLGSQLGMNPHLGMNPNLGGTTAHGPHGVLGIPNHPTNASLDDAASLDEAMGQLCLESPANISKVLANEFVPSSFYTQTPVLQQDSPSQKSEDQEDPIGQVNQDAGIAPFFYPGQEPPFPGNGELDLQPGTIVSNMSPYAPIYTPSSRYHQQEIPQGTTYYPNAEVVRADALQRNQGFLDTEARVGHYADLPANVGMYTDLVPLETVTMPCLSSSFRVTHRQTSNSMAMRRLHSTSVGRPKNYELWKNVNHPNIVKFVDYQESNAFGDTSTLLFYEYFSGGVTLMQKYFAPGMNAFGVDGNAPYADPFSSDPAAPRPYTHQNSLLRALASGALMPEGVLWSMLVQMASALRAIHREGLACRTLDPTKILVTGQRMRIAWCGVLDFTQRIRTPLELINAQEDDLRALGHLLVSLAIRTLHWESFSTFFDILTRTYSHAFKNIVLYLNTHSRVNVEELIAMIGIARFEEELKSLQVQNDQLEEQYASEMDNGRLLRILVKLGLVNERPELHQDYSWSETGDRYLLKLFRDYLFHAVNTTGDPWIDQGHITHCLNQLDSGTNNKIGLVSRDEESVLVVSFAELKHCLEQAVSEITGTTQQ